MLNHPTVPLEKIVELIREAATPESACVMLQLWLSVPQPIEPCPPASTPPRAQRPFEELPEALRRTFNVLPVGVDASPHEYVEAYYGVPLKEDFEVLKSRLQNHFARLRELGWLTYVRRGVYRREV